MAYKNKEDQAAAAKAWYEKNKELTKYRTKKWKKDNPEKDKQQQKARYDKIDPETGKKIGAVKRNLHKKKNPEKTKATNSKVRFNKKQKHFKSLLNEYALMLKKQGRLNDYSIITSKNIFDLQLNKSTWYVVYKGQNVFVDKVFTSEMKISFQIYLQNKFTPSKRASSIYVVSENNFINNILYKNEEFIL
tara:strand:+ start:64 stop:633 length:570 start_codon:yes stop_codon:yes gene_type:complete